MIFDTSDSPFQHLEEEAFSQRIWLDRWYPLICKFLVLDPEEDSIALKEVLEITRSNSPSYGLKNFIQNKRVIAIAPGVKLEKELETYLTYFKKEDDIIISADGATSHLIAKELLPNIIVTDLDGDVKKQFLAQERSAILLIHVHGDNYRLIHEHLKSISNGAFLITTQINPLPGSYNFYGFTDGDRIVCLSTLMSAAEIVLIGFDFGQSIGKYSKNEELNEERKKRKLKKFVIGKSIINWCANSGQKISFLSEKMQS